MRFRARESELCLNGAMAPAAACVKRRENDAFPCVVCLTYLPRGALHFCPKDVVKSFLEGQAKKEEVLPGCDEPPQTSLRRQTTLELFYVKVLFGLAQINKTSQQDF